jgi:HPt (histidine-containing phosphotransfer) domain-containing protein
MDDNNNYTVTVEKDLADLIPVFMGNRRKEIETLRQALASGNFEQLRQVGHRMRGVGNSYGFNRISEIGKQVEDGAVTGDRAGIESCIGAYSEYISRVQINYE